MPENTPNSDLLRLVDLLTRKLEASRRECAAAKKQMNGLRRRLKELDTRAKPVKNTN